MLPIVGTILGGLLGGGGAPENTAATSGDATSALSFPFNYGGNVQAGGKGNTQSQPVTQEAGANAIPAGAVSYPAAQDKTLIYVALGVAGFALVVAAIQKR